LPSLFVFFVIVQLEHNVQYPSSNCSSSQLEPCQQIRWGRDRNCSFQPGQ